MAKNTSIWDTTHTLIPVFQWKATITLTTLVQFWRLGVTIPVDIHSKGPRWKLNLELVFHHITGKLDWIQWNSFIWNRLSDIINTSHLSKSFCNLHFKVKKFLCYHHEVFFGSAAIKPIFSGKCSASRLHFCSFHYYNKPIFIYPNKYIFWKKKVFSCSSGIKFQASDTFWPTHLKNNSSSAVVNRATAQPESELLYPTKPPCCRALPGPQSALNFTLMVAPVYDTQASSCLFGDGRPWIWLNL